MDRRLGVFVAVVLLCTTLSLAQTPTAVVNGQVRDISGSAIPNATVVVINDATGIRTTTETNAEGIYSVPNLPPGTYHIQVSKQGFKTIVHPDITLHVQDAEAIGFTLPVGPTSDTVTVEGGAPLIDTESAAVSTVVDHKYVENMPLNGRSFQDLILLTPGIVTNNPQNTSGGEFSVNGQRTESNYYTVDGVSGNASISPLSAATSGGPSGSLPVSTALGTTQALVSIDALEEFRVQSSTYSAEYGRSPGGQFSFVTRSGTNQWHGDVFDYLRNNVFDANDWFNDYYNLAQPPLRQNDFGGTLGGPVWMPHLYNGRDKTFFFFSYEGLRLIQPQGATQTFVPDTFLLTCSAAPLQQVLKAFPQPPSSGPAPNCANPDPGNGLTPFTGTWSNPSDLDSTSIRLDHAPYEKLRLFFRFSNTSSSQNVRNLFVPSVVNPTTSTVRTYTVGANSLFSKWLSNEFRLNYSSDIEFFGASLSDYGGATPVNLLQIQGFSDTTKPTPDIGVILRLNGQDLPLNEYGFSGKQRQWNIIDTLALSKGRHQFKTGFDLRRLTPAVLETSPVVNYQYFLASSVQANSVDFGLALSFAPAYPVYTNFSTFAQDEWSLTRRLNISMGLRWEINPAPGAASGNLPFTAQGNSLSTLTLAPQGTSLWKTSWFNFAPRLGAAYVLRDTPGFETVIRGGGGVFFDTGQQLGSLGYSGAGFSAGPQLFGGFVGSPATFPLPATQVNPPIVYPPTAPYGPIDAFPTHLQLPYTLQWNASIEQALTKSQALTVSYVGARGRRLLEENQIDASSFNSNFTTIFLLKNGLTSDYDALQWRYQRSLARGLQVLSSYTWAHSIDFGSQNLSLPYTRGNSDYDIRHNFSGALSYDIPGAFRGDIARALLNHWGIDGRFTARTAFPVTLQGNQNTDPATGQTFNSGLDLVPNVPVYISGSQCAALYNNGKGCPGGRAINPNAFASPPCDPTTGVCAQGNAPRNFVRGFGAWQTDLATRREFPIYENLRLQFRAEAFNVFNHPNFGRISSTPYCLPSTTTPGCLFGQATADLANSLVGLSPLYQNGGARSMQLALKLMF